MSIKSLLIGSAAALVSVTAANAADAIVMPEPEPVEYVRVCDVYGAGFFYIPGTETCLAISGKVWFQIAASTFGPGDSGDTVNWNGFPATRQFYSTNVEADLQFDARSETEWGTLRGYVRLRASWDPQNQLLGGVGTTILGVPVVPGALTTVSRFGTDGVVGVDQAYISLGGLRMGYTESAWNDTMNGGASSWGSHTWGGLYYGYQQRHVLQYSFSGGNGVFATLSLEDDGNPNWVPDIVAVAGIQQGWGSIWVKGAYDEDLGNGVAGLVGARADGLSGVDGWAASAGLQVNVPNMEGSSFRLLGFYANNCNAYAIATMNTCANWSVLASYYHQFTPNFAASVGAQYFDAFAGLPNQWSGELALIWTPVTNFEVRTEINYDKAQGLGGTGSGFLRFTRYF